VALCALVARYKATREWKRALWEELDRGICLAGPALLESAAYVGLEHSIMHFPAFELAKMWGIAQETGASLAAQPAK
jgi:hypothetical protein